MADRDLSIYRQGAFVTSLAREWRDEAERRRHISKADPVPDVLEYCAGELAARSRAAAAITVVTVDEYAAAHHVTAQTVRNWCRAQLIPAKQTPKGWAIPKDAAPPKTRRTA